MHPATPRRILLVEDDDMVRGIFVSFLRHAGYAVDEARDGVEAVGLFRENPPACILLDLHMPGMNGLDALIAMNPRISGVPVIVISGIPFATDSEPYLLAQALGAARFLAKPVTGDTLLAVVRELAGPAG